MKMVNAVSIVELPDQRIAVLCGGLEETNGFWLLSSDLKEGKFVVMDCLVQYRRAGMLVLHDGGLLISAMSRETDAQLWHYADATDLDRPPTNVYEKKCRQRGLYPRTCGLLAETACWIFMASRHGIHCLHKFSFETQKTVTALHSGIEPRGICSGPDDLIHVHVYDSHKKTEAMWTYRDTLSVMDSTAEYMAFDAVKKVSHVNICPSHVKCFCRAGVYTNELMVLDKHGISQSFHPMMLGPFFKNVHVPLSVQACNDNESESEDRLVHFEVQGSRIAAPLKLLQSESSLVKSSVRWQEETMNVDAVCNKPQTFALFVHLLKSGYTSMYRVPPNVLGDILLLADYFMCPLLVRYILELMQVYRTPQVVTCWLQAVQQCGTGGLVKDKTLKNLQGYISRPAVMLAECLITNPVGLHARRAQAQARKRKRHIESESASDSDSDSDSDATDSDVVVVSEL